MSAAAQVLLVEHGALVRRLAALQQRVSTQLQGAGRRVAALEADNLRLRAELVRMRTAVVWGLGPSPLPARAANPLRSPHPHAPELLAAGKVICQTGCVGHAHPWLAADGHCRRTGQACARLEDPGQPASGTDHEESRRA